MNEKTLKAAIAAIFELQLSTREAINYVVRQTGEPAELAGRAVREALTGYKTR